MTDAVVPGRASDPLAPMQRAAAALWSTGSFWHPGGLAWRAADIRSASARTVLLGSEAVPRGWGWLQPGSHLDALVAADDAEGAREVAAWCVATAGRGDVTAEVPSGPSALAQALAEVGFRHLPGRPFSLDVRRRTAVPRPPADLPRGYAVRALRDGEQAALVACHRAAWDPHRLPWPAGGRPVLAPDAASGFSLPALRALESTQPYRRELVTVVEAPDGSLAASCIAWLDDTLGVAEIEPLGVVPEHRGRGLGRALCLAAVGAVGRCGGAEVTIHPRGDDGYPAPRRLYASCGFEVVGRTVPYARAGT